MDKAKFLGKLIFDFKKFMAYDDFNQFKQTMLDFLKTNKDLPDNEFLDKLDKEIPLIRFYNEGITRHYLSKISAGINVLKTLALLVFIASIIAGLIMLAAL